MIAIKSRIPDKKALFLVFSTCVFPIHFWAMLQFLREIPSYILWVGWFEIFSIFSYTQSIALFESIIFFIFVTTLAIISPRSFILDYYISQSSTIILIASAILISYHYRDYILITTRSVLHPILIYMIGFIIIFLVISISIRRLPKFEYIILFSIKKISVLSSIYLAIAVPGSLFSIARIITTYILWLIPS